MKYAVVVFVLIAFTKKVWVSVGEGWFVTSDNDGQETGICFYCEEPVGCISEEEILSLKGSLENYVKTGFPKEDK